MRIACPFRRSSHMRLPELRRPSLSYGTSALSCLGHSGGRTMLRPKPSSGSSMRRMSSDLPKRRSVIFPSCAVCCRFRITVPKPPPTDGRISKRSSLDRVTASAKRSSSSSESSSLLERKRTWIVLSPTAVTSPFRAVPGRRSEIQAPGAKTPLAGAGGSSVRSAVLVATSKVSQAVNKRARTCLLPYLPSSNQPLNR